MIRSEVNDFVGSV